MDDVKNRTEVLFAAEHEKEELCKLLTAGSVKSSRSDSPGPETRWLFGELGVVGVSGEQGQPQEDQAHHGHGSDRDRTTWILDLR